MGCIKASEYSGEISNIIGTYNSLEDCLSGCGCGEDQSCLTSQRINFDGGNPDPEPWLDGDLERSFYFVEDAFDGWKASFNSGYVPVWCPWYDSDTGTYSPDCYHIRMHDRFPSSVGYCKAFWVQESIEYHQGTWPSYGVVRKVKYRLLTYNCVSGEFRNVTSEYVSNLDPDCGGCADIYFENGGWVVRDFSGSLANEGWYSYLPEFNDNFPIYI